MGGKQPWNNSWTTNKCMGEYVMPAVDTEQRGARNQGREGRPSEACEGEGFEVSC